MSIQPGDLYRAELARVRPGDLLVVILPEEFGPEEAGEARQIIGEQMPDGAKLLIVSNQLRAIVVPADLNRM